MSNKVEIHNVSKVFTRQGSPIIALDGVTLHVPDGQFVCIVGPSGCGKTTLLRIVAGLEELSLGALSMRQAVPGRSVNSMIFQEQSIFPWMKVRDNIGYGLWARRVKKSEAAPIVETYLNKVGLTTFANAYPYQLSAGMKQRVSIARAFANDPELLLMDTRAERSDHRDVSASGPHHRRYQRLFSTATRGVSAQGHPRVRQAGRADLEPVERRGDAREGAALGTGERGSGEMR
jgi:NitT/TauT family transport system ATP-binding protein